MKSTHKILVGYLKGENFDVYGWITFQWILKNILSMWSGFN